MSKPKVSVILPSLNVEPYIDECIRSVRNSKLEDIEIICVDAGSTDGTLEIILDYVQKDSRIKVINSDKKSYGYQVNLGIEAASGEYVGIVDTDDYVDQNMYEVLYNAARSNEKPDFVKSKHDMFVDFSINQRIYKTVPIFPEKKKYLYNNIMNPREWSEILVFDGHIWKGIYKRSFLIENEIRLHESQGAAFQDNGFLFQTICLANRVLYLEDSLYRYRRDNVNASVYNKKGFMYVYNEYEYIYKFMNLNKEKTRFFNTLFFKKYYSMFRFQMDVLARQNRSLDEVKEEILLIRQRFMEGYNNGELVSEVFTGEQWMEIVILMEDIEKYYEYILFLINIEREKTFKWIDTIKKQQKVVIFGKGDMGSTSYFILKKHEVDNIVGWCDNNPKDWGKFYMGKKVFSPKELLSCIDKDMTFVIASVDYTYEIRNQLLNAGIEPENILYYKLGTNPLMLIL